MKKALPLSKRLPRPSAKHSGGGTANCPEIKCAFTRLADLATLKPNPRNPNQHPPEQMALYKKVVLHQGIRRAIVVSNQSGFIVTGHGLYQLCQDLGMTQAPVDFQDFKTPDDETAHMLADNRLPELADLNDNDLKLLLTELQDNDLDLELAGFTAAALVDLLDPDAQVDADPQADRAAEMAKEWKTKLGQLWQLGNHRLLCGDSTNAADVKRLLGDEKPRLMITDQPYGVEYDANWRNEVDQAKGKKTGGRAIGKVENDDRAAWSKTYSLFPGDVAYVWHGGLHAAKVCQGLEACGFEMRAQIIWFKKRFVMSRGDYHWAHEPCWYAVRKGRPGDFQGNRKSKTVWADIIDSFKPKGKALFACLIDEQTIYSFPATATTVWQIDGDKSVDGGHSTQKPVECMARPIRNHEGDVYEPFSGSGTTIIACQNLKRRCFAMELSPGYVAVALQRYQEATGKKPMLMD